MMIFQERETNKKYSENQNGFIIVTARTGGSRGFHGSVYATVEVNNVRIGAVAAGGRSVQANTMTIPVDSGDQYEVRCRTAISKRIKVLFGCRS